MKVVILAGGLGARLSEETDVRPKPMVDIGGKPILWHIMQIYSHFGFDDFVLCLGYKGYLIKEYFANYFLHQSDIQIDLRDNKLVTLHSKAEAWRITLVDTGLETMTGGRIKRIKEYIDDKTFMLTYGDGVGDINLKDLLTHHRAHGKLATVTAVQPASRFGTLKLAANGQVQAFREKPANLGGWINGGFFVLEPGIFEYLDDDSTIWERQPMEQLARRGQLMSFQHSGFWQPMDTQRDRRLLEDMWRQNEAPWKVWT